MTDLSGNRRRRISLRLVNRFRAAVAACFIVAQLAPPATAWATDFPGILPVALDQPRINAALRRTPTGPPLTADFGGGLTTFNITAFFDTGASGVLISQQTADFLEVERLRWPDPVSGQLVEFEDVGVAGSDFFNVSEQLYVSLAPFTGAQTEDPPLSEYNQTFGPILAQIGPLNADPNPLLEGLDIFGMPTMTGKVIVMDPKPTDPFSNPTPDVMRTYVYNPGTPFNSGTATTNPGIPEVDRHVDLSYASFDRFTQVTPAGAPFPTLRSNPFLGPNPLLQLDPDPPVDTTPGVSITFGDQTSTGSWLLDTGAAASIISLEQAANLHVRYVPGTDGTDNPRLETFDPMNPSQPGRIIPDQYTLDVGGIGGTTRRSGFYLDSLLLRTLEGNPQNDDDPNHLRFLSTGVLVADITLEDAMTQQSFTLDAIFGMNMLVATASIMPGPIPFPDALQDGYFNWVVFDEPNGTLGVDLKGFVAPPPNEWLRTTGGNWGSAGNWSQGFVPDGDAQSALLGMSLGSNGVVNLQTTNRTVRQLRFSNDDASYTVASEGGTLVFDSSSGPAAIQFDLANTRSHEISAPIRIASDLEVNTLDSSLPLTLSGGQTWEADRDVAVRTGTLRYNLDVADLMIIDGGNTLVINEGATVELAGSRTPLTGSHSVLDVVTHIDVVNNSAGGLLIAAGNHEAGSITGLGSTSVNGGSLSVQAVRQSALSVAAGHKLTTRLNGTSSGVSVLGSLSLAGTPSAPTAAFDLTNNAAVIDYSGTSPVATVRQQIIAGRGGPGMNATWTGSGITSSTAAGANATAPESRSVGYAENGALPLGPYASFHGQAVDNTSILMAYTRTGDANLDGVVNDNDVTIVGATYAPGVAQPHWALGDFDYNGFVDDDDVTLLGVFYDPTAAPLITPAPAGEFAVTAVPEPASIALLATMAAVLLVLHRSRARRPRRSLGTAGRPV